MTGAPGKIPVFLMAHPRLALVNLLGGGGGGQKPRKFDAGGVIFYYGKKYRYKKIDICHHYHKAKITKPGFSTIFPISSEQKTSQVFAPTVEFEG